MTRQNLTRASRELFRRGPDERFPDLDALLAHCRREKEDSTDRWHPPPSLAPDETPDGRLGVRAGTDGLFTLNDWSFGQLCSLARVSKETVNRLAPVTAAQVLRETLPGGNKPLQLLTRGDGVRSVHGTAYTRLHNADLVSVLKDYATDFQPPQVGMNGGTGLYCGEQDLFAFLIDPAGWAEIDGQAFAPGFFVWNSEVGKRSVGIQTFWFQAVCANHIVWDAVEVIDFSRKHTASVGDALGEIRRHVEQLVRKRDERRDGFLRVIRKAMEQTLGEDAEAVMKELAKHGLARGIAKQAVEMVAGGRFTIFALVDALTRLAQKAENAGDRTALDVQAAAVFALAA
ncbi:DUF932 domain-containing protein [bacterium]|nr:DUF932 domain-containing protein [bacterium]